MLDSPSLVKWWVVKEAAWFLNVFNLSILDYESFWIMNFYFHFQQYTIYITITSLWSVLFVEDWKKQTCRTLYLLSLLQLWSHKASLNTPCQTHSLFNTDYKCTCKIQLPQGRPLIIQAIRVIRFWERPYFWDSPVHIFL